MNKNWYISPVFEKEPLEYWWKKTLMGWGYLSGSMVVFLLCFYSHFNDRPTLVQIESIFGLSLLIAGIWILFTGKYFKVLAYSGIFALLVFPNLLAYYSGGFIGSGGRNLWSFMAPIASMIFFPGAQTFIILALFISLLFHSIYFALPHLAFPVDSLPILFSINAIGIFTFSFLIFYSFFSIVKEQKLTIQSQEQDQDQDQDQRTNKLKTEFINVMSHEIRTPLNAIVGQIDLLSISNSDEEKNELIESVTFTSNNLVLLVNDILDYSKIQDQKIEFEKDAIDIHKTFKNTIRLHQGMAKENNVTIHEDYSFTEQPYSLGDQVRLGQIINNLISNAIKFSGNGKLDIKVIQKTEKISFYIKDTGIGISKEKQENIFNPFAQVDASINRRFGGTGLGLAIIKGIITQSDGTISLNSKEGEGSEFIVELPWPSCPAPKSNFFSSTLTPLKILVVDDNSINVKVACKLLAKLGMHPHGVISGAESIEWLKDNSCDLIFMDLQMPELDGFETSQKIQTELLLKTPIVALSAEPFDNVKNKLKKTQLIDFIPKPMDLKSLKTWLISFQNKYND